eukprot:m.8256 g.8256  ORF g.8256 m.8256 type:complete len:456 (-) comp4041_c0_seq2:149-1516(-)
MVRRFTMFSYSRFRNLSPAQQNGAVAAAIFLALLGLHYLSWYYDSVLIAMAGDRGDPEVAARYCGRHAHDPPADRFWRIMRRYGGDAVDGGGHLTPLERLDLDLIISRAQPKLVTATGLAAIARAERAFPDRIPPTVHQTYTHQLTADVYPTASKLPQAWEGLAAKEKGGAYKFWDDASADAFLAENFHPEVMAALRALVPGPYKADLFRYCVIYIQGGVYADIDVRPLVRSLSTLLAPGVRLITPKQDGLCRCGVWQGLVASAPGHPAMLLAILLIVAQTEARLQPDSLALTFCPGPVPPGWDDDTHLYLTGPDLLGRVISSWMTGESCGRLTPGRSGPNGTNSEQGGRASVAPTVRSFGVTHLLKQDGRLIGTAADGGGGSRGEGEGGGRGEDVADTPKLPDLSKRGHCPRYRWLWHTRRAYTDTGRFLGWDVRSIFDGVGCTIAGFFHALGL